MVKVSIIGTAGRKDVKDLLKKYHFDFMVQKAIELITVEWGLKWEDVELVSGGAAWAGKKDFKYVFNFFRSRCCDFIFKTFRCYFFNSSHSMCLEVSR
jgi:hypothetical protein